MPTLGQASGTTSQDTEEQLFSQRRVHVGKQRTHDFGFKLVALGPARHPWSPKASMPCAAEGEGMWHKYHASAHICWWSPGWGCTDPSITVEEFLRSKIF